MLSNKSNGSCSLLARGFATLRAVLAMGLVMASPAEAAPFAYVANFPGSVSVIDTATNTVVATVAVGSAPLGLAVTPDGKHAYVTNDSSNTVLVIDTATNTVVATVVGLSNPNRVAVTPDGKHAYVTEFSSDPSANGTASVIDTASNTVVATVLVGIFPVGVAVTPDGKHAYVANSSSNNVSVIDTATNTVVATVVGLSGPSGVAVTPDGKHAYVTNSGPVFLGPGSVSVIDTATNSVVATVPVGIQPAWVAVAPDGKHAYVAIFALGSAQPPGTVLVIDTASNEVAATVRVGNGPDGVAVTPDGKHVYVANQSSNNVSVIDTASNTVVATVKVGTTPIGVAIVPPPPGVPFLAFNAKLQIHIGHAQKKDAFGLRSSFTLSSAASNGINPVTDPVTLQVGTFTVKIPPGSFRKHGDGLFTFHGVVDGVRIEALIRPTGTLRYAFHAEAHGADLTGTKIPVQVTLTIDDDSGTTSVKATNFVAALE